MAKKKLTKAEKQALKQKEKEEFEYKTKKGKLDKELDFTKAQVSEIRRKVFEQAQLINLPIIKEEWLHKWGFFERTVDWKDFYISQLRDDIFYYELHHKHIEQIHNENMDKLLEIYSDGISKIMDMYLVEREKLTKERSRQETRLVLTQNRRVENMESIMIILMQQRKKEMENLTWENANQKQLKIFRYEEAVARIAQEGDEQIKELWGAMKAIFDKYKTTTFKKRQEYLMMKQRDLAEMESLDKLTRRMTQLHRYIKQCRGKLSKMKVDEGLRLELELRRKTQDRLKQEMRSCSDYSSKQLETVSLISTSVIRRLTAFCNKINEAISLLAICRKLETEEEKVSPKLTNNPPLSLFKNNQILPLFDDMEQLWAKMMHVTRMKEVMASQLQGLKLENFRLNQKLRSVLTTYNTNC